MAKITRLTQEQRDDLIAYLDGELDQSSVETVEASLSQNQVARHDLNQLSKTYDLLNFLPKVKTGPELTQQTLSKIEIRESEVWKPIRVDLGGFRRFVIGVAWIILLSASAIAAYQISQHYSPDPAQLLLQDLPVIQNMDRYSEVQDMEFLRELQRSGAFEEKSE